MINGFNYPTMTFADTEFNPNIDRKCFIKFSAFNTQMPQKQCKNPKCSIITMETPVMFSPPNFMWGWQITTTKLI